MEILPFQLIIANLSKVQWRYQERSVKECKKLLKIQVISNYSFLLWVFLAIPLRMQRFFHISSYVYRKFRAGFRVMLFTYVQSHLYFFLVHRLVGCILDFSTVKSTLFQGFRYLVIDTVKLATKCKSIERRNNLSTSTVFLIILYYCILVF